MSTGERRRELDGLRGIAVVLVVLHHSEVSGFPDAGGVVGVTAFFTLSGYLITALLLAERDRAGRVDLRAFYVRRARRLLPALGVFLLVMAALGVAASSVAAVALYVGNWVAAFGDASTLGGLTHTWSLAIEEQFYLVWPLVVIAVLSRFGPRVLAAVALAGAAVSVVLRFVLWDDGAGVWRVYFGSDTRADALLIGCAFAAVLHGHTLRTRPGWATSAAVGLVALVTVPSLFGQYVIVPLLAALLTAVVIATARSGWLTASWLTLVGRRSYALYLWHFPLIFVVLPALPLSRTMGLPLVLAFSWLLALASWRYVEAPFLALKDRPSSSRRATADPPATTRRVDSAA